jgi:hypothetical protein
MDVILTGTVARSIQRPEKKMVSTSVFTNEQELQPTTISTKKVYKPGDKVKLRIQVNSSLYEGKAYLNARESDDQNGVI